MNIPLTQSYEIRDENHTLWGNLETHIDQKRVALAVRNIIVPLALIAAGFVLLILGGSIRLICREGAHLHRLASWLRRRTSTIERLEEEETPPLSKNPSQEVEEIYEGVSHFHRRIVDLKRQLSINAKLAVVGQTVAMFAHDVRKPLSVIEVFLKQFGNEEKSDQSKAFLHDIQKSKFEIDRMSDELLEFAAEKGLAIEPCDLKSLIASSLRETLRFYENAQVNFEYQLNHTGDLFVDIVQTQRLFKNILANAFDAMSSKGRIWFQSSDTQIDGHPFIQISIGNSDSFIPPEEWSKVFDPFYTRGKEKGTGLGLAICYRVVTMHGGSIGVRSDQKTGTEFFFTLPSTIARERVDPVDLWKNSREAIGALGNSNGHHGDLEQVIHTIVESPYPINLLIVDDEPLFRRSLRSLLNQNREVRDKVSVAEASSGEEALALFEKTRFDVVIADVMLGEKKMNGFDFTRKLLARYPRKTVLIHSNLRLSDGQKLAQESGASGFLPKPMTLHQLLQFLASQVKILSGNKDTSREGGSRPFRIGILDDSALLREGYRHVLAHVLGPASPVTIETFERSAQLLSAFDSRRFDIALLDVNLEAGDIDGLVLAQKLRSTHPELKIVLVTNERGSRLSQVKSNGLVDLILEAPLSETAARSLVDNYLGPASPPRQI